MEQTTHAQDNPELDTRLTELRGLLSQQQFAAVQEAVTGLLAAHPGHRELLYLMAVAQRMRQQIPEALATLDTLEAWHPRFPRLYQERGHCHIFRRDAQAAIVAFERAVNVNSALPASWRALQTLYRMVGRSGDADLAQQTFSKLAELPSEVVAARSMLSDGLLREAEDVIRPFVEKNPSNIEGLRLLANIAAKNEYPRDAEILLHEVLRRDPDYRAARYEYVLALVDQHKHVPARQEVEKLIAVDPGNAAAHITLASILLALGDVNGAVARYCELEKQFPQDPELVQSLGHALKTEGDHPAAVAAYRRAASVRPGFGEAWWSLANLKTYRFTDAELAQMLALEAEATRQPVDRYHLCFALGKGFEDRGEYAESFAFYSKGNALKKTEIRYLAQPYERSSRRQREICGPEFFAERRGWGSDSAAPIFILGLPRAGSTLLEQILASHSQVEGTTELADVPRLVSSLSGREGSGQPQFPDILLHLDASRCRALGEGYLKDTLDYRQGKPFFIDKMPNNFRNIGLIHLMLPNARIIDARRDAMDCCFSNFKQLYANGHPFAYSLGDVGHYYRVYVEMMEHWDNVLPGRVLRVNHDDVLADLEGSVRRLLDYCGLPFEQACLEFHKTERRVHTASSEQVRRPINRDGVEQWKPYSEWLGPLREALGPLARG
jgi:tetratricopeptide (TPR) repeat protein